MKIASPLFSYAHEGKLFYKAVMKRLNNLGGISLAEFCSLAEIEFSTAWRWNHGSKPGISTVNTVEKALVKLERLSTHTTSSTSISPIAIR